MAKMLKIFLKPSDPAPVVPGLLMEVTPLVRELLRREIEIDKSYFGGTQKWNRARGAAGKITVFGMLE